MMVVALMATVGVSDAEATIDGAVYCDANQNGLLDHNFAPFDTPLANVRITARAADGSVYEAFTDSTGWYVMRLPGLGGYTFSIDTTTIPNNAAPIGSGYPVWGQLPNPTGTISIVWDDAFTPYIYFLVDDDACRTPTSEALCWMTAGGVKFDPVAGLPLATHGPRDSFGGNVYPGCNANSGNEGGQWNHVAHSDKLHFQGFQIEVTSCGNVPGIPEGSTSPVTPYNFIEFRGTGRLKGIHGNDADYPIVSFTARVEDRGEPGNEHGNKGDTSQTDTYYLHVFDAANTTLLLFNGDANPANVSPLPVTGGNLQLHFNPCPEQ